MPAQTRTFNDQALVDVLDQADLLPGVESLRAIRRDVLTGRATMGRDEARFFVDAFYLVQNHRIRTAAQIRQMEETGEPVNFLDWMLNHHQQVEKTIGAVLGLFAQERATGRWAMDQYGIGPVLAAGLEAHIDIAKAPAVGHIMRFAGLDPTIKWLGRDGAKKTMAQITEIMDNGWPDAEEDDGDRDRSALSESELEELLAVLPDAENDGVTTEMLTIAARLTGRRIGNLARLARDDNGKVTKSSLLKLLARRPWNARLKTLTWKIGQSFMKFSNRPECFYGVYYRERKAMEIERNESGQYREIAERLLASNAFRAETEAHKAHLIGRLPAGHIDARARRASVKLFLSHWHEVAYEAHYGKPAPVPYPIAHLEGHVHYIARPS